MRTPSLALVVALTSLVPVSAFATGYTDMTWDGCVGPVQKTVLPGSIADLYVSVFAQSETAQAYQLRIVVQSPGGIPDAWRFDPVGCQGPALVTIDHKASPAIAKTCPSFQGNQTSLQIKDFSYDPTTTLARITLANAYPNGGAGNPAATDPNQRYFLMHVAFDETFGVNGLGDPPNTCGGLDRPVCFWIQTNSWIDLAGVEHAWDFSARSVLSNDPKNLSRCPGFVPVAAQTATWGSIKSHYRQ